MSKKEKRITIRVSEDKFDAAEAVKKGLDMSVAEQFRTAYEFWFTVIYNLATGAIGEEKAIEELLNYASVIEGKYKEPQLIFKKAMEEAERKVREEKEKEESEGAPELILPGEED